MLNFIPFAEAVSKQVDFVTSFGVVLEVDVDRDELFSTYIAAFPEGTNPLYKERTEHDCNCCKNFIRNVGNVVAVVNGEIKTIWDIDTSNVDPAYVEVANALAEHVRSRKIKGPFRTIEKRFGTKRDAHGFDHFHCTIPKALNPQRGESVARAVGKLNTFKEVLERGVKTITLEATETVLDLISQNSLYRGKEHEKTVRTAQSLITLYKKTKTLDKKQHFLWTAALTKGPEVCFKNTVIGSLLEDLSNGKDIEKAVASFESKVAPQNYKRTSAPITQTMIAKAQETLNNLGLETALNRRLATLNDLSVNNTLFVDRTSRELMKDGLLSELLDSEVQHTPKKLKGVTDVNIKDFIKDVLPRATSIDLMVDNKHSNNFVSLVSPVDTNVQPLFKWDNNFSWSYHGEATDSIKERVKRAGGKVDAPMRVSLSWFNYDDLDLSVKEPSGRTVYFSNKRGDTGATLDVDMNAGGGSTREAVENIYWSNTHRLKDGNYEIIVHNFCKRENIDTGFELEVDLFGELHHMTFDKALRNDERVVAGTITVKNKKATLTAKLPTTKRQQNIWNVTTNTFTKVRAVTYSPNYWDDQEEGNQHVFFLLDNCISDEETRTFYNEYLRNTLTPHRKVFEVLASKMKVKSDDTTQLSGVGFSTTQRNNVVVKVTGKGNTQRLMNIIF